MRAYVDRDDYLDSVDEHRDPSASAPDVDECHGGCGTVCGLMQGENGCGCGADYCFWCVDCWEVWENGVPKCSICGREIDFTDGAPLCTRCEATARAHGKHEADAQRYPDPEHAA